MDRDEKLRRKFAQETQHHPPKHDSEPDRKRHEVDETQILMEWQDVTQEEPILMEGGGGGGRSEDAMSKDTASLSSLVDVAAPPSTFPTDGSSSQSTTTQESEPISPLGASLAQTAIREMTEANSVISSPVAAVALALHSILQSRTLGFKCTGIPEEESKAVGGFAKPVRELPKGQFLPRGWDQWATVQTPVEKQRVWLRYRKSGIGASVLKVFTVEEEEKNAPHRICIQFGSNGNGGEEESNEISFPIQQHVNDDSLGVALAASTIGVKPALHYKALPVLVTKFCHVFDLGPIADKDTSDSSKIHVPLMYQTEPSLKVPAPSLEVRPSIPNDLYRVPGGNGDFSGDLMPGGVPRPGGMAEGNLMGPNHRLFQRDFDDDFDTDTNEPVGFPTPGGLGMQPRFDAFYPPGVQGNPPGRGVKRGRGRGRGRFTGGDPNPDHQKPPNDLGGNMFM